jgi:hypothetical protein
VDLITDAKDERIYIRPCDGDIGRCEEHQGLILSSLRAVIAERDDIIEKSRMYLVAISVVALANTPESAKNARLPKDHEYWTPSHDDVCTVVDREMSLHADLAAANARITLLEKVAETWKGELYRKGHNISDCPCDYCAALRGLKEGCAPSAPPVKKRPLVEPGCDVGGDGEIGFNTLTGNWGIFPPAPPLRPPPRKSLKKKPVNDLS